MVIYDDNHVHCFSCGGHRNFTSKDTLNDVLQGNNMEAVASNATPTTAIPTQLVTSGRSYSSIPDRSICRATAEAYGVTTSSEGGRVTDHYYPYTGPDGKTVVAVKQRKCTDKEFFWSGKPAEARLFGKGLCAEGGKFITITEGEVDAMSVLEMTSFPAVSVRSASTAFTDCRDSFKYLDTFDKIVLCFDADAPGYEAAQKVATLFPPGKVLIMDMGKSGHKDANDYLRAGQSELFKKGWWNAKPYSPDTIVNSSELWDLIKEDKAEQGVLYPWEPLNNKTYGIRKSELITVTAGTGIGKTTFCKFIAVHLKNSIAEDENVGLLMIEETTRETALSLMSIQAGIPFHLPDSKYDVEQKRKAYDAVLGSGRFYIQADKMFAYSDIDGIVNTIKYMANGLGCKYIVLDHVSIVVSSQENGDERRAIDALLTRLKTLTIQLNISLICVCHLKRLNGTPAEEGAQITLSDLRGTAGIAQLSNIVLALERNGQAVEGDEANRVRLRVLKNRFSGRVGLAGTLLFNDKTMQFSEVAEPVTAEQEANQQQYEKFSG